MKFMVRAAWLVVLGIAVANCSSSGSTPTAPTQPTTTVTTPTTSGSGVTTLADPDAKLFGRDRGGLAERPRRRASSTRRLASSSARRRRATASRSPASSRCTTRTGACWRNSARTSRPSGPRPTADGTTTRENGAVATIHRAGEMMTTGLGPGATSHTLNGREHGTVTTVWTAADGTKVTTTTTIDGTTVNLVVPVRAGDRSQAYPAVGHAHPHHHDHRMGRQGPADGAPPGDVRRHQHRAGPVDGERRHAVVHVRPRDQDQHLPAESVARHSTRGPVSKGPRVSVSCPAAPRRKMRYFPAGPSSRFSSTLRNSIGWLSDCSEMEPPPIILSAPFASSFFASASWSSS